MKALLKFPGALLMLAAGLVVGAMTGMVQDEIRTRLTRIPDRILHLAALIVPAAQREDLRAEWQSEASGILEEKKDVPFTGLLRATWYALGLLSRGRAVARALDGTSGTRRRQLLDLLTHLKHGARALAGRLGGSSIRRQVIRVSTPVGSIQIAGPAALAASAAFTAVAAGIAATIFAGSGVPPAPATAGWTPYQDPSGFSIKIPPGWAIHTRTATEVTFTGPQAGFVVLIGWTTHPEPDVLADWRHQAALKTQLDPNYQQIGIHRVTYRGYNTADWEFTNMYHGQLTHVLDQGFMVNPSRLGYAIELFGPDTGWSSARARVWDRLLQSFTSAR